MWLGYLVVVILARVFSPLEIGQTRSIPTAPLLRRQTGIDDTSLPGRCRRPVTSSSAISCGLYLTCLFSLLCLFSLQAFRNFCGGLTDRKTFSFFSFHLFFLFLIDKDESYSESFLCGDGGRGGDVFQFPPPLCGASCENNLAKTSSGHFPSLPPSLLSCQSQLQR